MLTNRFTVLGHTESPMEAPHMATPRRRRTERLFLRYPIKVEGTDSDGKLFGETTHTVVVNRHGCRIVLMSRVSPGHTVKVTQVVSGLASDFRVVGLAGPSSNGGGEWGLECCDEKVNFWGISFPPLDESVDASSALLECGRCHEVALIHFSMVEYDLIESTGALIKTCNACKTETQWTYAQNPTGAAAPPLESAAEASDEQQETPPAPQPSEAAKMPKAERRASPRVPLRLPIRVRNADEVGELTKSENVSKGGIAFTADKAFEVEETIFVTCPYNPGGGNIEVQARVVRREKVAGTERYLYGVKYVK